MSERRASERDPDMLKLLETREKYSSGPKLKEARRSIVNVSGVPLTEGVHSGWNRLVRGSLSSRGQFSGSVMVGGELSSEARSEINNLASRVEYMKQELALCKRAIDKLRDELNERPVVKQAQLFDIDEKLDVIQPVPIVIEEFNNEVIVSFPEVEVFAVGNTEPEAICNLKTAIRDLYYDLIKTPKNKLGKLPLSWLRTLERLMIKLGND